MISHICGKTKRKSTEKIQESQGNSSGKRRGYTKQWTHVGHLMCWWSLFLHIWGSHSFLPFNCSLNYAYIHLSTQIYISINIFKIFHYRASLVAQWLRICLLMQETRVRALVWEDPTCRGATRPVSHNCWACASGACAPQQERPRWWEARAPRWRAVPAPRWRVAPTCRN